MRQIREHQRSPHKNRRDFLSRFLEAREKFPDVVDEDLVHDYANTNVAGGSDTTAIILRTLIYQLLTQKQILDKVLGEIGGVLRARQEKGDADVDRPIAWAEGLKMSYYQACIKEALRFHPATAQILPRVVPKGGVELCGFALPEGTVVGCNAWTIHRDRDLYGEDADSFIPERWLDASPEQARKMESLLFTFGAGKRACVGKNIAILEITKFVPEFIRRFEGEIVDQGRWKTTSSWLAVQSGLDVKLKSRPVESLLAA
jgi:cytochrome P450